ncbi:MAG: hypothetical protein ABI572_00400 [Actinomycetota bacterium]
MSAKRLSLVGVAVAFAVASVMGFATTALSGGGGGDEVMGPPAKAGEPTYRLTDFEAHYPYLDITPNEDSEPVEDPSRVGIRYTTSWADGIYPGVAICRFDVFDSEGNVMGSLVGDVESLVPVAEGRGWTPIEAYEAPSKVEGVCTAGHRATDSAGYDFANVEIVDGAPANDTLIVADVGWKTDERPGTQTCAARLVDATGDATVTSFTIDALEEHVPIALIPNRFKGGHVVGLSCEPFS